MSSSQKNTTKPTKASKASKKKSGTPSATPPLPIPSAGCYIPQPPQPQQQMIDNLLSYGQQIPPQWLQAQYVNNWLQQTQHLQPSPPQLSPSQMSSPPMSSPQMSPPLDSQTQFVPETQFNRITPRRLEEEESDDEEEETEEATEEEEEEEQSGPSDKGKAPRMAWNNDEIKALGEAWVDCSQQAETGINQTTQVFKVKVWNSWCRRMGKAYRKPSAIYSKWRTCNKGAMEFQGCYQEVERQRQSGANGDDVMAKARLLYEAQYGSKFNQEVFWNAVKDYEKWKSLDSFDQFVIHLAKKHKVSETTHSPSSDPSMGFNLNDDPPPPMGRDQAKRKARGKGKATSISSNSSVQEDLVALSGNVEAYKEAQKSKENAQKMKETNLKIKEKIQLRKILQADISGKTGFEYDLAMEMKRDAARQLGYNIPE